MNASQGTTDSVPLTGNPGNDADGDDLNALMEYALGASDNRDGPFAPLAWDPVAGQVSLDHPLAAGGDAVTQTTIARCRPGIGAHQTKVPFRGRRLWR